MHLEIYFLLVTANRRQSEGHVAVYGLPFTVGGYINHPLTLHHDFHSNSTTRNIQVQVT